MCNTTQKKKNVICFKKESEKEKQSLQRFNKTIYLTFITYIIKEHVSDIRTRMSHMSYSYRSSR